jgi:hypothetical protein
LRKLVALLYIVEVLLVRRVPALQVVMGMVADTMPFIDNPLKYLGMALYIIAHAEEGGLDAIAFQNI